MLFSVLPVVLVQQLAFALHETALQMVVKERYSSGGPDPGLNASSAASSSSSSSSPTDVSNFYMTLTLINQLVPILPAVILAKIGDRGWRKVPLASAFVGYLLVRVMLLLVIVLRWPLELVWAGAALQGLCGGFCSYWAGVMALVSVGSTVEERSRQLMRVELLYGVGGLAGSLMSGYLYDAFSASIGAGSLLVIISMALFLLCLFYCIFLMEVREVSSQDGEERSALISVSDSDSPDVINIVLLFAAAIVYDVAVGGAMEILGTFEIVEPLNWDSTQVGYGNGAGYLVFLTSFLGVMVMSRCVSDASLIIIGMLSFTSGIYFMAFVTETYMFYLARSLTLFSLIPTPTIRSMLSKQVKGSSYGIVLSSLQLSFQVASLAYTPAYTKIYQATLTWSPGFVFTLSSIISVLAIIPISIVGCRSPAGHSLAGRNYQRIPGD